MMIERGPFVYTQEFDLFCLFLWLAISIFTVFLSNIDKTIPKYQRVLIGLAPTIVWCMFIAGKLIIRWLYV